MQGSLAIAVCAVGAQLMAPAQVLHVPSAARTPAARAPAVAAAAGNRSERLQALVAKAVASSVPPGWHVADVRLEAKGAPFPRRGPAEPLRGAARVEAHLLGPVALGKQPLSVVLSDDRGPVEARHGTVTLERRGGAGVKRGDEVTISLRTGNVLVTARCSAQGAGAVGERITVLCDNATRTLSATVTSAKEVEVVL
jgi:hypothetical protein